MKKSKYPACTERATYEVVKICKKIISTNCVDKVEGHSYRWLFAENDEDRARNEEILKEHPSWRGIGLLQCKKCGKYNASM